MASFVVGILVAAVTFYLALIYASTAIGLLGCAEAVLLVLAFFYLMFAGSRIGAGIRIPLSTAECGGKAAVLIDVENRCILPSMRIRYRMSCSNLFCRKIWRHWYAGASVPAGKHSYRAELSLAAAGNYTVVLERVRIYDLSGFFYRNLRVQKAAVIQVLPEMTGVGLRITENLRNFFGDSDVYDDFRPGDDRSEIFDVREFRDGDKIQRIHWKLSAKSDDLVVREDSQPLACPVVLLLDCGGLSPHRTDAFLSVAASIMFSMMDSVCPHFVSWLSAGRGDMVRARVDDEEGYYIALCGFLGDCTFKPQPQVEERYLEKYRYDRPLHVLVLKGDLSLWQDGEKKAVIDRDNWKDTLERLELIL